MSPIRHLHPPGSMAALIAHLRPTRADRVSFTHESGILHARVRICSPTLDYDWYSLFVVLEAHKAVRITLPGWEPRYLSLTNAAHAVDIWAKDHTAPYTEVRRFTDALQAFFLAAAQADTFGD